MMMSAIKSKIFFSWLENFVETFFVKNENFKKTKKKWTKTKDQKC